MKTYTITVTGRWMPVVNVWEHGETSCFQVAICRTWAEAEAFIKGKGGVVPARPDWAKNAAKEAANA